MKSFVKLRTQSIFTILLIIFLLIALIPFAAFANEDKKNILIIQSYHKGYKWSDDIMSGIGSIINTSTLYIDIDIEYMDSLRLSDETFLDKLYEIYSHKYSNKKIDAVICCDDNAYQFVLKHQSSIFSNKPIIFCGTNYFDSSKIKDNKMITGIVENYDIEENLKLIAKLHPKTKNIYVINDNTTTGQAINKKLNELIPKYKNKFNFINLQNYSLKDITKILNNPQENSAVLFLIFFQDFEGRKYNYDESINIISQNSSIPIYGTWEFSLGHGIVGGMLTSGYFQGKTAAEITLRILNGETPDSIPIVNYNTNSFMFDYSQMNRFGITLSEIPSNSYIINRSSIEKKQILILNSYHDDMKWTKDIVTGIKTVLASKNYDLYIDYMDIKRNYTSEYKEKIEDLLKYRYKDKKFDLIITSDNDAYDFIKRYYYKLFPSIPLVFCGLNYYSDNDIPYSNSTGVIESIDAKKTLELALLQNPDTKRVIIINDTTLTGKANKSLLLTILPHFKDKVEFIFYENMNMSEIQQKVSELNKDTIIYLLSFNIDDSNNIFSYEESTELITSKSKVPIYGAWDFNLAHGIVGGLLANGESQGKMAAEMAIKILSGEKTSNIPVIREICNKYMFDYNTLKKYNIDLSTLPKDSIVVNKPESFSLSRTTLIVILSLIIPLVLLLVFINYKNLYKIKNNKYTIKELETTASIDFLTNALNRTAGFKSLYEFIETNIKFSLCFIDLNNLKGVNDNYGHTEGDTYIKTAISFIQKELLENHVLFRFGGDEFIILFPHTSIRESGEILTNINKHFDEYNLNPDNKAKYEACISYGFSEFDPETPITAEELIDAADKEMYIYKRNLKMKKS